MRYEKMNNENLSWCAPYTNGDSHIVICDGEIIARSKNIIDMSADDIIDKYMLVEVGCCDCPYKDDCEAMDEDEAIADSLIITLNNLEEEKREAAEEIAEGCEAEGYPAYGSNFDLRYGQECEKIDRKINNILEEFEALHLSPWWNGERWEIKEA